MFERQAPELEYLVFNVQSLSKGRDRLKIKVSNFKRNETSIKNTRNVNNCRLVKRHEKCPVGGCVMTGTRR